MSPAADFHHSGIRRNRLKPLQQIADAPRCGLHPQDHFVLVSANVLGLAFLVGKLTLERPLGQLFARRFSPSHSVALPFTPETK